MAGGMGAIAGEAGDTGHGAGLGMDIALCGGVLHAVTERAVHTGNRQRRIEVGIDGVGTIGILQEGEQELGCEIVVEGDAAAVGYDIDGGIEAKALDELLHLGGTVFARGILDGAVGQLPEHALGQEVVALLHHGYKDVGHGAATRLGIEHVLTLTCALCAKVGDAGLGIVPAPSPPGLLDGGHVGVVGSEVVEGGDGRNEFHVAGRAHALCGSHGIEHEAVGEVVDAETKLCAGKEVEMAERVEAHAELLLPSRGRGGGIGGECVTGVVYDSEGILSLGVGLCGGLRASMAYCTARDEQEQGQGYAKPDIGG